MTMSSSSDKLPKTAAELMQALQKDPDHQERIALRNRDRRQATADVELNSRPVIVDLRTAGISVTSLDELRTSGQKYDEAVPILISWLKTTEDDKVKEALVRTLSVPWASDEAERPLIDLFLCLDNNKHHALKWATGNALSILSTGRHLDKLIEIVQDERHGTSRQMVVLGLANVSGERSETALINLLSDPQVAGHAIMALGKLRATKAVACIRPFLKHKTPWLRAEARKALALIDARREGIPAGPRE
jgi:HEAT repeat protein